MSLHASPPIELDCSMGRIHRYVSCLAVAMTLMCSIGAFIDGSNGAMRFAAPLLASIVAAGLWNCGWFALGNDRGLRKATWTASGLWYLAYADGTRREALLLPGSQALPGIFVFRWRHVGGRSQAFVFTAHLPADLSRRLRTRLRYEASPPAHALEPGAA